MDWDQLKQNNCPKCSSQLRSNIFSECYECTHSMCDFKIGDKKFDTIIENMYKGKFKTPDFEQNLSDLNNL